MNWAIICMGARLSRETGVVIVNSFENTHLIPLCPPIPEETDTAACVSALQVGTGVNATELVIIYEEAMNPRPLNQITTSNPVVIFQACTDSSRNLLIQSAAYDIANRTTVIPAQKLKDVMQDITAAKKIKKPKRNPHRLPNKP